MNLFIESLPEKDMRAACQCEVGLAAPKLEERRRVAGALLK
jgi:hypothetical protein